MNFWQWPIIRTPLNGHAFVAIFFLLAGYNNALKPIKTAREGNPQAAASDLMASAFRKTFRFVLPTMCAQVIIWLVAELGYYDMAARISEGEGWLGFTSPKASATWVQAFKNLLWSWYSLWVSGECLYDRNYWAMLQLLKASFMVYVMLLITLRCAPRYRMMLCAGMYIYCWMCDDCKLRDTLRKLGANGTTARIGLNVYAGIFLAELSMAFPLPNAESSSSFRDQAHYILPLILAFFAVLTMGHPSEKDHFAMWTRMYKKLAVHIFPTGADYHYFWCTIGEQMLMVSIMFSADLQKILSHPIMLWLGRISFAIYLLHGFIVRTFMLWLLYGLREPIWLYSKDNAGNVDEAWEALPNPHGWMYPVCFAVTFALLLFLSHIFTEYVEQFCAFVTRKLEEVTCPQSAKSAKVADMFEKGLPKPNGLE